jgi:hypothetical protein
VYNHAISSTSLPLPFFLLVYPSFYLHPHFPLPVPSGFPTPVTHDPHQSLQIYVGTPFSLPTCTYCTHTFSSTCITQPSSILTLLSTCTSCTPTLPSICTHTLDLLVYTDPSLSTCKHTPSYLPLYTHTLSSTGKLNSLQAHPYRMKLSVCPYRSLCSTVYKHILPSSFLSTPSALYLYPENPFPISVLAPFS